ncbi:kinesin-domain-containing protein [Laetiporus sulphureus 93-53]|uniref:Kinesin-domain-containing protein n=1 Tax=Laetiporus sulphureus 93-53 TaxID=1314785 RepID=A0A165I797_9APHY|nr:kinesin-domain-containing protein [Laetiporus sulphureus 93-53]KZT12686.1 kinesin-domain-containing protein [Laetiporus sulphureus 93-53]
MAEHGDGNIKVVVRCRPLNSREVARGARCLVRMEGNQTILDPPEPGSQAAQAASGRATERKVMNFAFDKSYWSAGSRDEPNYCSQQTLYDDLGKELLDHGFAGFNACILAYGQTGSGKSYSMMGYGADKGIIPLTCSELFARVADKKAADLHVNFTVEVSYIEIYNEKVRDLLNPKNTGNLRVREHPSLGPYVEDLSKLVVSSYEEMMTLMDEGNKARTVAATNMNETSSRSHAVFTLILTMKRHDVDTNLDTEKVSRISLVDLAGSERANSTGATGQRLKEGANINKSLTTLGKVISALAAASSNEGKKGRKGKADDFVPYRDSVLTWLLKDSLGGNSKTAMIAAISPADVQYEETLSTLRYADQAKKIKNKAIVNEDPNAKLVRELKEELETLRARVAGTSIEAVYDPNIPASQQKVTYQAKDGTIKTVTKAELQEQLETSEKLMQSLNETWEQKMQRTQDVQKEREKALEELGITIDKNNVGVHTPKSMPHLVNLNEDPLMSECLIYQLKPGRTMIGRLDSEKPAAIRLSGESIAEEHCYFENTDGKVMLYAMPDGVTFLNGRQITAGQASPFKLKSGYRVILGEHHVFRFNNPDEVRKQRDRAAAKSSSLQQSISAAELQALRGEEQPRPDSPTSSEDMPDVDWTFAKREAALARLGLDPALDNMPDEDLNKLYEKITKVKTLRDHNAKPRPESSLSQVDDIWSESGRPISSDAFTDDTSVDATMSHDSPDVGGPLKDVQNQLETQRIEFESRLQAIAEANEAEDLKAEKEQMEHQLKLVQTRMKRLLDARARGESDAELEAFEPVIYSAKQLRLIRKTLEKWRTHRSFSMAQEILSNAVHVKEANVIRCGYACSPQQEPTSTNNTIYYSKELGKDVSYNFTIASGGSLAAPASAIETIAGLDQFGDVVDPVLASATQPSVAVKVIDKRNNAIYLWSLDRLQHQLQRMRNLTTFIDRPSYSQHFSSEEPFYDSPSPEYSFIGDAMLSLAPLTRRLPSTSVVPIFCRYTAEAIGTCRIDLKIADFELAPKYANHSASSTRASSPALHAVPPGSKLSFVLTVDSVKGLSHHDFASLHMQVRLSSFMGPSLSAEEVYPSAALDMDTGSLSDLKFRRSFTIVASSKVLSYLRQGYAPVEFFARLKPTYLERIERWDDLREQRLPMHNQPTSPESKPATLPLMRRSETDFVVEQTHDVVAWLQISELTPDGTYGPVPVISHGGVDPGAFMLHQGLQRRIVLSLFSNSGKQLPWTDVVRIRLGNVRVLDAKGRLHDATSKSLVTLPLLQQQTVEFRANGTATLSAEALWDSSVHDSDLLNRVTGPGRRIMLQLSFFVSVDICAEPVQFTMDTAVCIQSRDARPPSRLLSLIGSTKIIPKTSTVFTVRLSPPLTRSAKDLWRLDTAEKYVRGEEALGAWRPRGVSAVDDYNKLVSMERRAADVQAIRMILDASPHRVTQSDAVVWASEDLLRKALALWQKKFGHPGEIVISQEPVEPDESSMESGQSSASQSVETIKLNSSTKVVPRSDTPTKKGHLMVMVDANENVWEKRWFVLRRPYMHVYTHSSEIEETSIINLNGVNIERNTEMEALLGKQFTFTLFTASNSYALAAPNLKELQSWTLKLDPTRLSS